MVRLSFSVAEEDYRITRQRLLKAGPEMTAYVKQLVEEEERERGIRAEPTGGATVVTDDDGDWEG